jgi:hypothetical protein
MMDVCCLIDANQLTLLMYDNTNIDLGQTKIEQPSMKMVSGDPGDIE